MYAFARYLSEFGHRVTVLSVEHRGGGCNLFVTEGGYHLVKAAQVEHGNTASSLLLADGASGLREWFSTLRFRAKKIIAYRILGNFITTADSWFFKARAAAMDLLAKERFDTVISSFSPITGHLLAYTLKGRCPDICWVADYRDLWSLNECVPRPVFPLNFLQRWLEKILNSRADLLVTVSKELCADMEACFNRPVHVVENGYFPEDLCRGEECAPGFNRKYTFAYTGSLYRDKQDPAPFFLALKELISRGRISSDEVEVRFYGENSYLLKDKVRAHGLENIVTLFPLVSRDESFSIQRQATALIFLESDAPGSLGVLTGKLFEYMISGRPVIAVGISEVHAAGRLLAETGTGYVCGSDVDMIINAILEVLEGKVLTPDLTRIEEYRRDRLVAKLAESLKTGCRCHQ